MGSVEGGQKVKAINLAKDPDYYRKLGHLGGSAPKTRPAGFAVMSHAKVAAAGRKGGSVSSRKGIKTGQGVIARKAREGATDVVETY